MLWLRGRALLAAVGFWMLFHASTYLLLTIHFLPTAICLLAFLPLERIGRRGALRVASGDGRNRDGRSGGRRAGGLGEALASAGCRAAQDPVVGCGTWAHPRRIAASSPASGYGSRSSGSATADSSAQSWA